MKVSRQWMNDWQETVNIQEGSHFKIGLELSDAGLRRYESLEKLRAEIAMDYARALVTRGIKINFDTAAWRNVSVGNEILQQNGRINSIQ